jgi:hypothetical protein
MAASAQVVPSVGRPTSSVISNQAKPAATPARKAGVLDLRKRMRPRETLCWRKTGSNHRSLSVESICLDTVLPPGAGKKACSEEHSTFGGLAVRISFPPAESPCLTQTRPLQVENCGFRAGVRRSVGGAVGGDAEAGAVSQLQGQSRTGFAPASASPSCENGKSRWITPAALMVRILLTRLRCR